VNSLCWAPHELGPKLVAASSDGSLSVLEYQDGAWKCSKIDEAHPVGATSVSWDPTGTSARIASAGCDSSVKLWRYDDATQTWRQEGNALVAHSDWVRSVSFAPASGLSTVPMLASAGQDGQVIVWREQSPGMWTPTVVHAFTGGDVWKASWSTNGGILSVTDSEQNVTLWKEVAEGRWQQL